VFTKARPLTYALRPKVEKELEWLEQDGSTPIVTIVKKSGDVRI